MWARTQEALVNMVVNGMGITFSLSFVVLVIATGNIVLAVISIFTIAGKFLKDRHANRWWIGTETCKPR